MNDTLKGFGGVMFGSRWPNTIGFPGRDGGEIVGLRGPGI